MLLTILIWELFLLLTAFVTAFVIITPSLPMQMSNIAALVAIATSLALLFPLILRPAYWLIGHVRRDYFFVKKLRWTHAGTVALHVMNVRDVSKLRTSPTDLEQAWNELIDRINEIANSDTQVLMQSHLFTRSKVRRLKNTFPQMRIHVRQWRMPGWQEGLFRAVELCKQWRYPQIQDRGYMLVIRSRRSRN
ncbi:hypothetical protein DZA65_01007 [Dickeya dianthicola]|nr:hypothetical protein [Dickeya dianthicola]AYC17912.1 hypothetical protein DZA65_01007 [Dickeya dianthicola]MBI0438122.1 hypothetical protein [Dickeya dianthicola]MBI0448344.1 hypothetical protein [Dickeya dianthicola]MBI0453005.1 hypothetical protein [Dickeya dianthicola]MBI0457448.1 hypothetical protein [Dickeya dianthicola]